MLVDVGELTFEVTESGPPDGPPVVLLHGFPQTARSWRPVGARLTARGLRTLAPNQRGYSPGARPGDVAQYTIDLLAGDVLGLLDALELSTVDLVGHDWGSVVAWAVAGRYPERVRSLTAVSVPHPAAYGWALANDPDQQQRSSYIQLFRIPGKAEEVLLEDSAARLTAIYGDLDPEAIAEYVVAMSEPGALTAALSWYRAMDGSHFAALGPVGVPTTFVWSTADLAVGRVAAERCARHVTGDYRFVELPGVSHWIPEEAPDALASAVLARVQAAG